MEYATIILAALAASALTFVSGFGLGTLLLPAFALFVPIEIAVGATAVVHLANNLFKLALVGKHADRGVLFRFALPAVFAALLGAALLGLLAGRGELITYAHGTRICRVTSIKLVIAIIMIAFACLELSPRFDRLAFDRKWLGAGGVVSGFFGGLSGHQGALRSAFLVRCGLSKDAFIATGVVTAVLVDMTRLAIYALFAAGLVGRARVSADFGALWRTEHAAGAPSVGMLILVGCAAALAGSLLGQRIAKKLTLRAIRVAVGIMLLLLGVALGSGVI
jgi:uncharacterized protein